MTEVGDAQDFLRGIYTLLAGRRSIVSGQNSKTTHKDPPPQSVLFSAPRYPLSKPIHSLETFVGRREGGERSGGLDTVASCKGGGSLRGDGRALNTDDILLACDCDIRTLFAYPRRTCNPNPSRRTALQWRDRVLSGRNELSAQEG